ncbi:hypothetical protein M6B38_261045 [Iris pallida]|uniref:Uncharacterized protein n=1 Tax=Iris pallida TaxID=29817 RepID=A0AAX6ID75_IRIPA|nr:hypothetical protein M6B38_261045 [Iris pallida]
MKKEKTKNILRKYRHENRFFILNFFQEQKISSTKMSL